ncbi:Streptomyces sporulation and cell division protein, SsgA [Actinacidiphila alni]|uniref:Streptomyces sporulation and cell division protein, SsgA n=1 Tax=Actinacidiphila alni TaxID=380248 RepID=A0A1I2H850_9ACTN|nr:SsgA family sporulation/cell division regulator [Actinacidiphila alni]SFF25852.1 Streptomyces sporulation and cell division protein, SsgA [Actinacidiphila alni]
MPDSCRRTVTATMLLPGGRRLRLPALMVYDPKDCLAVRVTFGLGRPDAATWVFAWELLSRGLTGAAGIGDVRVAPVAGTDARLLLRLGRPGDIAELELDAADVLAFVAVAREHAPRDNREIRDALAGELSRIRQRA